MMPIAYIYPNALGTAPRWSNAFAKGCGGHVQSAPPFNVDAPIAFWGEPRLWREFVTARDKVPTWYYGDHAFFGRGRYYRCARNAMQFDGSTGDDDLARFRLFKISVKDWRSSGSHILLCPNSEEFLQHHGFAVGQWIKDSSAALRAHTDRPIRVRWKTDAKPLDEDLRDCWAVVTFTSNCAVLAALHGVPVICTAACAGLKMGSSDLSSIEHPAMPEGRERWAARLANRQWTLDEMSAGALWSAIGGV